MKCEKVIPLDHPLLNKQTTFAVSFEASQIENIVDEMAAKLNDHYGQEKEPVLIIGVLKGCFLFMADLMRKLEFPFEFEFIRVASYHGDVESSGKVNVIKNLPNEISEKNILVLEEIVDSGRTLDWLKGEFASLGCQSFKIACLFDKISKRVVPLEADFVGRTVEDFFLLGYGLDLDEYVRNLDHVVELRQ